MRQQSTSHIIMMEPLGFHSNPETRETNTYQAEDPLDVNHIQMAAVKEFRGLRDALVDHGVIVTTWRGSGISPDDLFCNNWVSTHRDDGGRAQMVLYPMLAPNRRLERRAELLAWLRGWYEVALDLSVQEQAGRYLESTGSLALDRVNKRAYCALSARTDLGLAEQWCQEMGYELVAFHTRNHVGKPVYHTDVVMFIGTSLIGICADCIVPEDVERVLSKIRETHRLLLLSMDQLRSFCGNALEVRGTTYGPRGVASDTETGLQQQISIQGQGYLYLAMSDAAYKALLPDQKDLIAMYFNGGVITAPIPTIEKYGGGSVRCMLLEGH
jgi:hypothetical protein